MRFSNNKYSFGLTALLILIAVSAAPAASQTEVFGPDSLIIPMDTTRQDEGIFEAYGLVYRLLLDGVPVDWAIAGGKQFGDVDFRADVLDLLTTDVMEDQDYRGGPFVISSDHYIQALPLVQAWQQDHPAVTVHRATAPFPATVSRRLTVAPSIAVFVDGREEIAFQYLNAAAIPMGNGQAWPDKQDNNGGYACPGRSCCADCLDEQETAGPTTADHADGALFDAGGTPRFCQFLSMHYKEPAGTPEVVAEVREFLQHPVHFLAECEAVTAFENDPNGRFLTGNGLVAGTGGNGVDHYHSDDPFVQGDGGYATGGGNVGAFSLDTGSYYYSENVVMLSRQGTSLGVDDIWMNGHMDADPAKGKVSYLGGHKYGTHTPISGHPGTLGTRFFLNSLFEAPCTRETGQPSVSTWITGNSGTNSATYDLNVCYENVGPGIAFDAVLGLPLVAGSELLSVTGNGIFDGSTVTWDLGSLAAGAGGCFTVTLSLAAEGSYGFASSLDYSVGLNDGRVDSGAPMIVRYGQVNLLRYGGVTGLDPLAPTYDQIFLGRAPAEPGLDPGRDLEVVAFTAGLSFPHDVEDLLPGSPPLVLYELGGDTGDTLRVRRWGSKIVITF
jgi:hypothetical protein